MPNNKPLLNAFKKFYVARNGKQIRGLLFVEVYRLRAVPYSDGERLSAIIFNSQSIGYEILAFVTLFM